SDLSSLEKDRREVTEVTQSKGGVTPPVTVLHHGAGKGVTADQVLQFFRENPSASYVTAAANLNIARQTVSRHVARLLEDGRLEKDGDQLVITDRDGRGYA
ncbi:MAG: winged helix-turn-helix domain-containing protein, partial [Acholeplasmataceae bacterium]|nr:winged helix-turn-helix domain-containing protein [Acholeplasmataceae bacterium]